MYKYIKIQPSNQWNFESAKSNRSVEMPSKLQTKRLQTSAFLASMSNKSGHVVFTLRKKRLQGKFGYRGEEKTRGSWTSTAATGYRVSSLDLSSSSRAVGTRSISYLLPQPNQKLYKFRQMPLLNGNILSGTPLPNRMQSHLNIQGHSDSFLPYVRDNNDSII